MATAGATAPQGDDRVVQQQTKHRLARAITMCIALLCGPVALAVFKTRPGADLIYQSSVGHFWIVTAATVIAALLALVMLRVAVVRNDGRVLLIGTGFVALSTTFLVHAISTPNVAFHNTSHATSWSTPLALLLGAILLTCSTIGSLAAQPWLVQRWRWWLLIGLIGWAVYAGFMLLYVPHQFDQATVAAMPMDHAASVAPAANEYGPPRAGQPAASNEYGPPGGGQPGPSSEVAPVTSPQTIQGTLFAIAPYAFPWLNGISILLYLYTASIYGGRWRRTPTRPLASLTIGALLLAETALAAQIGVLWHFSFWLYHVLLLAAVLTTTYGIVLGYEQSGSLSSAVEGLLLGSTLQRQQQAFQRGMATLLDALERGDIAAIPRLRQELRQRFGLAEDQLDLLEGAVYLVAKEREEQHRLRALVEVSRAATLNLDPNLLLQNALSVFSHMTGALLCAVGLVDGDDLRFDRQHCLHQGIPGTAVVRVPLATLPPAWFAGEDAALIGTEEPAFAPIAPAGTPSLLLPLQHRDRVLGVLMVRPKHGMQVDESLVTVCRSMGAHLATALVNARLYQEVQQKHQTLLMSEQAREQLTQMVVHDLKNPLTAIRVYNDLLAMTELTSPQQELVEGAQRGSSTMLQLIDDMLDVARLEEGRLELQTLPCDIGELLEACAHELSHWSEQEQKAVIVAVPTEMPALVLDARLMRRVVINLLSNALKHTAHGTAIEVGAILGAGGPEVYVHDNGAGIPLERQPTLFDRFTATPASGSAQSNTGLGLAFCKLAVEAHGGSIGVVSMPGRGTTFTVTLPLTAIMEMLPT